MCINHWLWGIFVNVLKWILNTSCRKNLGRERANLFLKCTSNLIPKFQPKKMRKVDKTIVLLIYYSLYHDKNLNVKTLLYAQLLYEIISLQKFAMSKKSNVYIIPTLFLIFLSAPAFLVPATVLCARIPGVFIDNRSKNVSNQYNVVFLNNCRQSRFM